MRGRFAYCPAERTAMNQKEIRELVEFLVEQDIAEFELERGDLKLRVKRGGAVQAPPMVAVAPAGVQAISIPAAPAPHPPLGPAAGAPATGGAEPSRPAPPAEAAEEPGLFLVKSPIVGTFYEAPSPGAPPFVKLGESVQAGQVLCIIEAMKLMNEIEAEVSGVIAKAYVSNASPVEYGMPLFGIRKA